MTRSRIATLVLLVTLVAGLLLGRAHLARAQGEPAAASPPAPAGEAPKPVVPAAIGTLGPGPGQVSGPPGSHTTGPTKGGSIYLPEQENGPIDLLPKDEGYVGEFTIENTGPTALNVSR